MRFLSKVFFDLTVAYCFPNDHSCGWLTKVCARRHDKLQVPFPLQFSSRTIGLRKVAFGFGSPTKSYHFVTAQPNSCTGYLDAQMPSGSTPSPQITCSTSQEMTSD